MISQLAPATADKFDDPSFVPVLRKTLGRDYLVPLMRGLNISVNGQMIEGWELEFKHGGGFEPMRSRYIDDGVTVELLAGMASPPPDDDAPEDNIRRNETSGWYVVCNGRVVLAADRSLLTGWGASDHPRWHPQYSGFVGMTFFSAPDAGALPMTTTKRSVDMSSSLYRRALVNMAKPTRQWMDYTNDRKAAMEVATKAEGNAARQRLIDISERPAVALPSLGKPRGPKMANILYQVPVARLRLLADAFGDINSTYREVGMRSFDYAYDSWVGEGDDDS